MFFKRQQRFLTPSTRTIKTFGLAEDSLRVKIFDVARDIEIFSHPKGVDITVSAAGATEYESSRFLDGMEAKIRERLGEAVYGTGNDKMEEALGRALEASGRTLAVAESCTGGLICHWVTNVPGCSRYFKQGFIVYSNQAKTSFLGVSRKTLEEFGAVSSRAVAEMAKRAVIVAGADTAIAVSGIAGPAGGSDEKPVGTVCICALSGGAAHTGKFRFSGTRETVKIQAAQTAIDMLRRNLR